MMEVAIDTVQNLTLNSNIYETKRKCITISEYKAMVEFIDSLIHVKNKSDFILNKYGSLVKITLSKYPHLNTNTVHSIIDTRIQYYVRLRHHRVFNNTTKTNSSLRSSDSTKTSDTPNQSQSHKQHNRLTDSTKTMYTRYKELIANDYLKYPLITLANNVHMPAMLVAKVVLADHLQEEKLKKRLDFQNSLNNDGSSTVFNDSNNTFNSDLVLNNSSKIVTQGNNINDLTATKLDTSLSVDDQLSTQLNWLTKKLLSMKHSLHNETDQSANSSINSNSCSTPIASGNIYLKPHKLGSSTWLINSDPQLAYEIYKCSVIDSFYGPCSDYIKRCMGQQFEQLLKQYISSITADTKSEFNKLEQTSLYITEDECRIRGLDRTPDMLLNEPIAISLTDDDDGNDDDVYTATNYVGGNGSNTRVLNWIESKAMFGGPDQLRTTMQRQLFPYWNRHGPGAVIYWFGHILEDYEKDQDGNNVVLTKQSTKINGSDANTTSKDNSAELSAFNFWSKYCLLMDGFPAPSRIVMHNHKKNSNNITKKNSTLITMS